MAEEKRAPESAQVRELQRKTPRIKWDDSSMRSVYANVCNAVSTREEVVLYFGISNPTTDESGSQVEVQLSDRVIMSPFAAKRFSVLLNRVLAQYEERFGALGEPVAAAPEGVTQN
jgi:hypothetical protein